MVPLPIVSGVVVGQQVRMMHYTVMLRPEPEGGFTVLVPALPGCISYGDTIDEALANADEAIRCHVTALRSLGKRVPKEGDTLRVAVEELIGTLLVYRRNVPVRRMAVA
jgi:predicted RNase H-like HicB family nuclease